MVTKKQTTAATTATTNQEGNDPGAISFCLEFAIHLLSQVLLQPLGRPSNLPPILEKTQEQGPGDLPSYVICILTSANDGCCPCRCPGFCLCLLSNGSINVAFEDVDRKVVQLWKSSTPSRKNTIIVDAPGDPLPKGLGGQLEVGSSLIFQQNSKKQGKKLLELTDVQKSQQQNDFFSILQTHHTLPVFASGM